MAHYDAYGMAPRMASPHSNRWTPPKNDPEIPPGRAWGRITEVSLDHRPVHRRADDTVPRGLWLMLFRDLMLRLEQTSCAKLRIPFPTVELARRAYQTLYNHAYSRGIKIRIQRSYGEVPPALYVRRGRGWRKPADSVLQSSTIQHGFKPEQETP